jgi:hypothetical protein
MNLNSAGGLTSDAVIPSLQRSVHCNWTRVKYARADIPYISPRATESSYCAPRTDIAIAVDVDATDLCPKGRVRVVELEPSKYWRPGNSERRSRPHQSKTKDHRGEAFIFHVHFLSYGKVCVTCLVTAPSLPEETRDGTRKVGKKPGINRVKPLRAIIVSTEAADTSAHRMLYESKACGGTAQVHAADC